MTATSRRRILRGDDEVGGIGADDALLLSGLRFPADVKPASAVDYCFSAWLFHSDSIPHELKDYRQRCPYLFSRGFTVQPQEWTYTTHITKQILTRGGKKYFLKTYHTPHGKEDLFIDFATAFFDTEKYYKELKNPFILNNEIVYLENDRQHRLYLVRDYSRKGSLESFVESEGYTNIRLVKKYLRQLLEGMAYLHEQGISHRNLKPSNVLIDLEDNIKVCDPNISVKGRKYSETEVFRHGPIYYTAPEQLKKRTIEAHCIPGVGQVSFSERFRSFADLWAIGIILFYILWGYHPYDDRIYRRLLKGKDVRPEPKKDDICGMKRVPKLAIEIYESLIQVNYNLRPSCQQLLTSQWLVSIPSFYHLGNEPGESRAKEDQTTKEKKVQLRHHVFPFYQKEHPQWVKEISSKVLYKCGPSIDLKY